jgi:hypothetical protein
MKEKPKEILQDNANTTAFRDQMYTRYNKISTCVLASSANRKGTEGQINGE